MAKSKHHYLKKSAIWLVGMAIFIAISISILTIAFNTHTYVANIVEVVNNFSVIARFLRWMILGGVIAFWDFIVDKAAIFKDLTPDQVSRAKSMRWKAAAYIIAFELLVIEAIPARLIG